MTQGTESNLWGQNMMEDDMRKRMCIYMCVYIYIYLGHFAVQQKLAQNCKPTIIKKCKKKLLSAHYVQCTGLAIGDTGVNPLKHFY